MIKVFVYRNLHHGVWSVKALDGIYKGKVILHCSHVVLDNGSFRVNENGRQRVLATRRKNVHAGAVGNLVSCIVVKRRYPVGNILVNSIVDVVDDPLVTMVNDVVYNPYLNSSFMYLNGNKPVVSDKLLITLYSNFRVSAYG